MNSDPHIYSNSSPLPHSSSFKNNNSLGFRSCWCVYRSRLFSQLTKVNCLVGSQKWIVWSAHKSILFGRFKKEEGLVGSQKRTIWSVHKTKLFGQHTKLNSLVGLRQRISWYTKVQLWSSCIEGVL